MVILLLSLLLLFLYLYVVAISCLFELIIITSVQHSTESCTEVLMLTLRGNLISLLLAFFMSMCVTNLMTGFSVGLALAWNRLSICLYYLVIINMLSFNRRFGMFLLRTALENNQVLTDVLKNVKM